MESLTTKYKPYPAYRPSGVEWLGNIPAHWETIRLKSVLARNDSGMWGDEPGNHEGTIVLRSTEQTIDGGWAIRDPAMRGLSPREKADALLAVGDLVVTKSSGSELHIGKTSLVTEDVAQLQACFSNFMQRLRCLPALEPKLTWYLLNSPVGRQQLIFNSSTTTGLANLNRTILGELVTPLPPLPEQHAIAAFLDQETARIDALVAKKEQLIELLQEKRTALITRAVTRGLDPNATMKDSGVEWLGEIPGHWEVRRLKTIAEIRYGLGQPPKESSDGLPLVRATNIYRGHITDEDMLYVDPADVPAGRRAFLSTGEIIVVRSGAYTADSAIIPKKYEGAITGYDMVVTVRGAKPEFIAIALLCPYLRDAQLVVASTRSAQPHLNAEELGDALILLPPLSEQSAIAAYLNRETAKLESLIAKMQEAIDRLKELRTALISAAVTGRIDVREEAG